MKKYIVSISIALLLFAAFFLMLYLTDTPIDMSLIGSGVATLTSGVYIGISLWGKPLKWISANYDNFSNAKRVGYSVSMLTVNMCVCTTLLETNDATIETLPLTLYGIALGVAVVVGIFTRRLFLSIDKKGN